MRRTQYRIADDEARSCLTARTFIFGKVYNGRWSIERTRRDHALRVDDDALGQASAALADALPHLLEETDLDALRGLEGKTAAVYFGAFDGLILNQRETFSFSGRSRRPPMDPINALLSFSYTLLSNACAGALESVGLVPYAQALLLARHLRGDLESYPPFLWK